MAVMTLLDFAKRTENRLMQGIALEIVKTDELAAVIPFETLNGQSLVYLREGLASSAAFLPDTGEITDSVGTDDQVTVPVRRIGSDMWVDSLGDDLDGGKGRGAQVAKKCKAAFDLAKDKIINGGNITSHTLAPSTAPFTAITAMTYGPWLDSNRFGAGQIKYTHSGQGWQFRAPGDNAFGDVVPATTNGVYVLRSFNRSKYIAYSGGT